MPTGEYVYLIDSSGNKAVITQSGEVKVDFDQTISVTTDISGQPVTVSGNRVEAHIMSGSVSTTQGALTLMRGRALLAITSNSGGVQLTSGDCSSMVLKNLVGNADMYVGGSGIEAPFSGNGFPLGGGEAVTMTLSNFNAVRVFASNSGQFVGYFGIV